MSTAQMDAFWNKRERNQLEDQHAAQVVSVHAAIQGLIDSHSAARAAIAGNDGLSESGKQAGIKELVAQSDSALDGLTEPLNAKLNGLVRTASRALVSATSNAGRTDVITAMRAAEIRSVASGMDVLEVEAKLQQLAESGDDDEVVHALVDASSLQNLVRPEAAIKATNAMASRLQPDNARVKAAAADALGDLEIARGIAQRAFASNEERGFMGIDTISLAAKGLSIPRSDAPGA